MYQEEIDLGSWSTGQARLIQSLSLARIPFELSGNLN